MQEEEEGTIGYIDPAAALKPVSDAEMREWWDAASRQASLQRTLADIGFSHEDEMPVRVLRLITQIHRDRAQGGIAGP